jgi:hypothetical protein
MRIKTLVLAGLVLWVWSAVPVFTQELESVPKNGGVGIVIHDLDQDAAYCNVDKSSLDAAVRLTLSRNGFRVNPLIAQTEGYLYVQLTIVRLTQNTRPIGCAINVSMDFIRRVRLLRTGTLISDASVWDKAAIMSGTSVSIGPMVRDEVENHTKQWIAQWLIDNRQ